MVGSSTLTVNESTMKEIVQEWLDKAYALEPKPRVAGIKMVNGKIGYSSLEFEISLISEEKTGE
jgi:hypothetical protein